RRDKAEREVERHLSKDMSTGENLRSYLMLAEPVFSGLAGGGTATSEHFRQGRHRLNAGARLCETKCQSREESRLSRRAACATETDCETKWPGGMPSRRRLTTGPTRRVG